MMRRNAGDYVKRWGAALIRGAATNAEFTVCLYKFQAYRLGNSRGKSLLNIVSVEKMCKVEKIVLKERCCRYC